MTTKTKEEIYREEFEKVFNKKYDRMLAGYTLRQWTTDEKIESDEVVGFEYYLEGRKASEAEIADITRKNHEFVFHVNELEQKIQQQKELIEKAVVFVEYAVLYSTPLSRKNADEWLEKSKDFR